jgi:hypothetical protein
MTVIVVPTMMVGAPSCSSGSSGIYCPEDTAGFQPCSQCNRAGCYEDSGGHDSERDSIGDIIEDGSAESLRTD